MFLRAILSREFLVTGAIVIAGIVFWSYQLNKQQTELGLLRSPENQVSLVHDQLGEVPHQRDYVLSITDYQLLGKPFNIEGCNYQLLGPKNADKENPLDPDSLVVAYSRRVSGEHLKELISNSKGGFWYPATKFEEDEDEGERVSDSSDDRLSHPEYPDLDLTDINYVSYLDIERKAKFIYILWAVIGVHCLAFPVLLYLMIKGLKKRDAWTTKLENYNSNILAQYPKAKRLCGLACPTLPPRSVDPNFDVTHKPPVKNPKLKRWGWKIGAALGISIVGAGIQFGTSYGVEQLLDSRWIKIGLSLAFLIGVNVAIAMAQQIKVGGRQEETVQPGSRWAAYKKLPFFKYHDHVLKSLGLIELGTFRQNGAPSPLVRTIYLSPTGNVLVEVGVELNREFFTIETVVNSGKFLETHSVVKPSQGKSDLLLRHQRRSASHEDILKALEDHDDFVGEFAGSGFNEAQFDKQKFGRFLEWGGEKNAS